MISIAIDTFNYNLVQNTPELLAVVSDLNGESISLTSKK